MTHADQVELNRMLFEKTWELKEIGYAKVSLAWLAILGAGVGAGLATATFAPSAFALLSSKLATIGVVSEASAAAVASTPEIAAVSQAVAKAVSVIFAAGFAGFLRR